MKVSKTDLRDLVPRASIVLTHSRKKAVKLLDSIGVAYDLGNSEGHAMHVSNGRETYMLVLMECSADLEQELAVLTHEAVHCADYYFEDIGESDPSSEFRAYVTQAIAQYLIYEHISWRERKTRKSK